jgi:micrococcal nuclease
MARRIFGIKRRHLNAVVMAVALTFAALSGFSGISLLGSGGPAPAAIAPTPAAVNSNQPPANSAPTPAEPARVLYPVVKVVDGDTLDVTIASSTARIGLLGVSATESAGSGKTVECFGREAAAHLQDLLTGKQVALESDPTQADKDVHGRLLRYVYLADGQDVGRAMVSDGYAYEYTYDKPYARQSDYKAAEAAARSALLGLWSPKTCDGKK